MIKDGHKDLVTALFVTALFIFAKHSEYYPKVSKYLTLRDWLNKLCYDKMKVVLSMRLVAPSPSPRSQCLNLWHVANFAHHALVHPHPGPVFSCISTLAPCLSPTVTS